MFKKGDKVIIHSHRYAKLYENQVFTCGCDETEYDDRKNVFLKELGEYGASMSIEFLKKIED